MTENVCGFCTRKISEKHWALKDAEKAKPPFSERGTRNSNNESTSESTTPELRQGPIIYEQQRDIYIYNCMPLKE